MKSKIVGQKNQEIHILLGKAINTVMVNFVSRGLRDDHIACKL